MVFLNWDAALVLVRLRQLRLRHAHGGARAGARWRWCSAGSPSARRITGVYFSIMTQAMVFAMMLAFFRNDMGFGGNNGLTDFKRHPRLRPAPTGDTGRPLRRLGDRARPRLPGLPLRRDVASWASVLVAVRDAESRVRFLGYSRRPTTSCSCSCCRPCWPASPAPSTCRRWASSIPASSRRHQLDRGRHLGRGRRPGNAVSARSSAPSRSTTPEELPDRRFARTSGCSSSADVHRRHAVHAEGRGLVGLFRSAAAWLPRLWIETGGAMPDATATTSATGRCRRRCGRARPEPGDNLLYLDGRLGQLRRLQGAERPVAASSTKGELRTSHRPERRRQDHDDGRDHGQDQARHRHRPVQRRHRPDPAGRGGDRQSGHRPQVPAPDGV